MKIKLPFLFVVLFTLQINAQIATSIFSIDSRVTNYLPQDRNSGVYFDFKTNTTDGLLDVNTYHGVMTFRPYGGNADFSGGLAHQLAFTDNGNMWLRSGSNATWLSWTKIYSDKNINRSDVDFNAKNIYANGNVGIGTTTPSANLEIFKNLSASTLKISNNDPSSLNTELRLGGTNTFEKSAIISVPNSAGWWRQDLYFCLANGNNTSSVSISDAAMVIKSYNSGQFGNVGIGTTNPDQKLTVKGKIHAEEIIVDLRVPADYVFQKYYTGKSDLKSDYTMSTLAEIEDFTKKNHHLPNVPSAQEVQQNGVSLGQMSNALLQKVEELTLYAIEQNKKLIMQQEELERLKIENENYKSLAERLSSIEKALNK